MMYRGLGAVSAFCVGIMAADSLGWFMTEWAAACLAAVLLSAAARKTRWVWPLFLLCCLLAGGARLQLAAEQYDRRPHYVGGADIYMEGTLREKGSTYEADGKTMARYVVDMERFAYAGEGTFREGLGAVYVTAPADPSFQPSARVAFRGVLRPIRYYGNCGAYDARHRDKESGIFLKGYGDDGSLTLLQPAQGWRHTLAKLRETMTDRFRIVLGTDGAHILSSLLFGGHYDELPPELIESFSITGLIHILSVSGSHIALLLSVVQILGRAAGLRGKWQFLLSAAFVLLYGAMAEFVAPVVRASIMGLICSFSLWARRDYASVQALAAAVLLMLLYSPYLLYDLSFRLSCGASAGIVLLSGKVRPWFSALPVLLRDGLSVCLCAQVLLLPLLFANFHSFPVYSFAANLLVAPVLDLVIVLGLAAAVLGFLCEPIAHMVLYGVSPLLALAVKGNYFLAALPHSRFWAGAMSLPAVAAWYTALAAVFVWPRQRRILLILAAVAGLGSWGWAQLHRPEAVVHVFDLGQDKATCAVYDDNSAYLWYNKSSWANPEQAAYTLTPALRYEGVFRLTGCTVVGHEPEKTAAQIEANFTLDRPCRLADDARPIAVAEGAIPYYLYDGLPQKRLPDGACIELRQLPPYDEKTFPSRAAALIFYRGGGHDERYDEWAEGAALYDIPWFSPARDGQITGTYRKGEWTFTARGGE